MLRPFFYGILREGKKDNLWYFCPENKKNGQMCLIAIYL